MRQATCTSNECEPEDRRKLASWIYERQQVYWPVASRSRLRSFSSFSLVIRGQASDNHRLVTELYRGRPSPSVAQNSMGEEGEATKRATAAAAGMHQPGASRRAPVEHLYREVVCVPEIFDHSASVFAGCQLATFRLRKCPFLRDGSGWILIRRPCSSLLFRRANATARSETSAISTN